MLNSKLSVYDEYQQALRSLQPRNFPAIGDTMKEFILTDNNERIFNSLSIRNKWVLINFWSNGCGPCVKEMDAFVDFYKSIDTTKATFISIALDETKERWKLGKSTNKILWTNLWTEKNMYCDLCLNYNLQAMPYFVLFNAQKKIYFMNDGTNMLENIKGIFKEKELLHKN